MGKRFLRSIVRDQTTLAATGEITPIDLPPNPLSHLLLTLWLERPAENVTAAHRLYSDYFAAIGDISVRRVGEHLIQGSLADLTMLNAILCDYTPHGANLAASGQRQAMTFLLSFSRRPYWHEEALPAVKRGDLQFFMNVLDLTPGTATAVDFALEAVQLIEDEPRQHLRYTTRTRTPTATGRQSMPLPIGEDILGVLLFDGLTEITATEAFTWGKVMVIKDSVQQYYAESNAESLRGDVALRLRGATLRFGHTHSQLAADVITGDQILPRDTPPLQYHWLEFDPLLDGTYALETKGAAELVLDANVDSIAGTPTMRYIPVELVKTAG